MEPLATEEEAAEFNAATVQHQQELERHYQQRYTREVAVNGTVDIFLLTGYAYTLLVKWTVR